MKYHSNSKYKKKSKNEKKTKTKNVGNIMLWK